MTTRTGYAGAGDSLASGYALDDPWDAALPNNAFGVPDASGAISYYQTDGSTQWLYLHAFGISLPEGAVVTAVKFTIWYYSSLTPGYGTNGATIELRAALTKDGVNWLGESVVITHSPTATPWVTAGPPDNTFLAVDTRDDLWGTTLSHAEVEASAFGLGIRTAVNLVDAFNNFTIKIDAVQITVRYNEASAAAGGAGSSERSDEMFFFTTYGHAAAVTPSDTANSVNYRALYIGGAGAVKVTTKSGVDATFAAVPAGTVLPIAVTRVYSNGTAATNILGLS